MGKIFISHSSVNNAEALAIHDWLVEQGWGDVFLDLDPKRGLVAGDRWQAALKAAAEQCELILIVISPDWAKSRWCLAEFLLAKQMNKQILGVLARPTPIEDLPVELTAEWQLVDLSAPDTGWSTTILPPRLEPETTVSFSGTGLARLRSGLEKAGLDATTFVWPPAHDLGRSPYRGLLPLDQDDAGIFFGRDGAIVLTLDALRGLRANAAPRFATILGASGAGKSSFLRAGILPRLHRDSRHFYVLPIVRPERAALTGEHGFAAMLEAALKARNVTRNRADIRDAVKAGADAVAPLLRGLAVPADAGDVASGEPPTLVITVDQAEELLSADNAEASAFLTLLAELGRRDDPAVMVLFTVRSDSFDQLQSRPELAATQPHHLIDLPPVPAGSFGDIIRGPARRVSAAGRKLHVDETLVDALLGDIEAGGTKDALPLLAFTLERLYTDYGADGDLQLTEYERLGRIRGAIEAAVEQALARADGDARIPKDRAARLALLRRGLIPWLAGIDPNTGSPRRRVARLAEVPEEARPLIELMVEQRLLATDIDTATKERTIEPAHEALLRQWGALDGWLAEDSADLATIEALRRAATEWDSNARASEFVAHRGARLQAVEQVAGQDKFASYLTSVDRAYLSAARNMENSAVKKARAARTRLAIAAAVAGVVLVAGGTAGYFVWSAGEAAKRQASSYFATARSEAALRLGQSEEAARYALDAERTMPDPMLRTAALNAGATLSPYLVGVLPLEEGTGSIEWMDDRVIALAAPGGRLRTADAASHAMADLATIPPDAAGLAFDESGTGRLFFRDARITDLQGEIIAAAPNGGFASVGYPAVSADAKVALFIGLIGDALVRDCRSLPCVDTILAPPPGKSSARTGVVSPDGLRVYVGWDADTVAEYAGGATPRVIELPKELAGGDFMEVRAAANGKLAIAAGPALVIMDTASSTYTTLPRGAGGDVAWSPDGSLLAAVCDAAVVCVYTADGKRQARLVGNSNPKVALAWSRGGTYLATSGRGDPLRIWSPRTQVPGLISTVNTTLGPDLTALAVDRERGLVAAGDKAGYVSIWSKDGSVERYARPEQVRSPGAVSSLAFLGDGRLAAVYENSGVGVVTPGGTEADRLYVPIDNASFSRIAALTGDVRAAVPLTDRRVLVLSGDELRPTILDADPDALTPWGLVGAGTDNTAFVSHSDGTIRRRNFGTGAPGETIYDAAQPVCGLRPTTDNNGAKSLDVSPDGKWLVANRSDAAVVLHNLADPARPLCLTLLAADSRTVAFSPDSTRLAILSATDRLYVFDLSAPDSAVILGAQLVADLPSWLVHPLGDDYLRQTSWLDWLDDEQLAIAAVSGQVLRLALDTASWRARVDSLFFTP
ncbi:MAG: TIR domain-containing protein [Devosia sp.]|uniref:nSTAND1 domain-containing NTPase n=1 Tax=Devosia sp. TaxID=1871048 RepID=UPI001A3A2A63|nr:TIR domain-containing protein [Devosia sp.]MBL8598437.1 TIR domain-containing protein [Devosia sp.]